MVNLKLYGKPSSVYEYVKMMMIKQAEKAELELDIEEINDLDTLIKEEIVSIPTIKVNNHIDMRYNKDMDINMFVRKLNNRILKEENYGTMKKILVPIDFSETSENACAFAIGLSKDLNGVIKVVHSYIPKALNMEGAVYIDPEIENLRREQLGSFVDKLNNSWIGDTATSPLIEKEFITGFAGKEIPELAAKDGQCMIVIGSTGSSGSLKTIFGSVSTMIAKEASCPVFVVPQHADYGTIKKIAYAADALEVDSSVVDELVLFTKLFDAELHLVHVDDDDQSAELNTLQTALLQEYPNMKIHTHVIDADGIVEGLNDFIERQDIDLLTLTKQKRSFLDSLFHSSITKRMTVNTKIPLLVLHR